MNINEQFEAQQKELEALKAQNETMLALNIHLANTIQSKVTDDKPTDLVWLTRDELQEYSDVHQAGGIDAIKADAIKEFVRSIHSTDTECNSKFNHTKLMEVIEANNG